MDEATARGLFDASAATYDRVNSVISLGLDRRWREWVARLAMVRPDARVLDAFAGTGLVGLRVAEMGGVVTLVDASPDMLAVARARAQRRGLDSKVSTLALYLGADETPRVDGAPFDAITVMWGLRYLDDPAGVLRGLAGLLRDGGRLVVVDFVEPSGGPVPRLAALYFFRILPKLAAALAGRRELYRALVATTHAMGPAGHLVGLIREAGFEVDQMRMMGFGLVCGVVGRRVADDGPVARP